uniref:Uncharacterized protein n=1 Tax=Anopheles merus TaxID=30066 RepID=A0A182VIT8_ANOME
MSPTIDRLIESCTPVKYQTFVSTRSVGIRPILWPACSSSTGDPGPRPTISYLLDPRGELKHGRGGAVNVSGRCHQMHAGKLPIVQRAHACHHQKHGTALRVADVVQRIGGAVEADVVHHGGQIVQTDLVEAEAPVFGIFAGELDVFFRERVAAHIPQPNVVPLVGGYESERFVRPLHRPIDRGGNQTVHDEHRCSLARNAHEREDVAVLRGDFVQLDRISVACDRVALWSKQEVVCSATPAWSVRFGGKRGASIFIKRHSSETMTTLLLMMEKICSLEGKTEPPCTSVEGASKSLPFNTWVGTVRHTAKAKRASALAAIDKLQSHHLE